MGLSYDEELVGVELLFVELLCRVVQLVAVL